MIRCTRCSAVVASGHEVMFNGKPFHTSCVPKVNQRELFTHWWRDDPERAKCTLEQAVGAYLSTYPGRALPLLVELLEQPWLTKSS